MTAPKLLPDPEVSSASPVFPTTTKNISSGRLTHQYHVELQWRLKLARLGRDASLSAAWADGS
jgi:hypothetical protein